MKKLILNKSIVYQKSNGSVELRNDGSHQTIWASLPQIADLFDTDKSGISRHIRNILQTKELSRNSTVAKFATVQKEGKREIKRTIGRIPPVMPHPSL